MVVANCAFMKHQNHVMIHETFTGFEYEEVYRGTQRPGPFMLSCRVSFIVRSESS